jgi:hypothetical protein
MNAMGIVHKAIEDGVCQGRVWDSVMLGNNGELRNQEGGHPIVAIVQYIE